MPLVSHLALRFSLRFSLVWLGLVFACAHFPMILLLLRLTQAPLHELAIGRSKPDSEPLTPECLLLCRLRHNVFPSSLFSPLKLFARSTGPNYAPRRGVSISTDRVWGY